MDHVTLPPDLEQLADEAVAGGRYGDMSDLVTSGLVMLRRTAKARAELLRSVQAADSKDGLNALMTFDKVATRSVSELTVAR